MKKQDIISSIRKAKGQIYGIEKMIEAGTSDDKIIQQLSAVRGALASIQCHCVTNTLRLATKSELGRQEIDKLSKQLKKLI